MKEYWHLQSRWSARPDANKRKDRAYHPHASSDPKTKPPCTAFQLRDSVATHCKLGGKW